MRLLGSARQSWIAARQNLKGHATGLFLLAALAAIALPIKAQMPTCSVFSQNVLVRAESYTDMNGDVLIQCTGGIPTPPGQPVPAATLTVFVSQPVTSKITDTANPTSLTAFIEALAIIDEPNSSFAYNQANSFLHRPVLACGSTGGTNTAPYETDNPGVCTILGSGVGTYDGSTGHPNVFQGRLLPNTGGNAIQFVALPIDPPGPGNNLIIRLTNIRINAVAAGVVAGTSVSVVSNVGFTSPNAPSFLNNTVQTAVIRTGISSVANQIGGPYPTCGSVPSDGGSVTVTEGFPSSFKTRNWRQMQDNGINTAPSSNWAYNGAILNNTSDLNQNVPGVFYSTESGFMFPNAPLSVNGDPTPNNAPVGTTPTPGTALASSQPFGVTTTGLSTVGQVSNGTRFAFVFNGIPAGSNATVPSVVNLVNTSNTAVTTGVMVAVTDADANGAGGKTATSNSPIALSETGPTTVIYEVLFSNFVAIEQATVPVTLAPGATFANSQSATATVQAGFAPFYAPSASPNPGIPQPSSVPVARFISKLSDAATLFSFKACTPDLTITKTHVGNFKQGQNGTYTITVSNTGQGTSSGIVSVADALPSGLSGVSASGTGWTCAQPAGPCSRSDALASNASYPPITITVKAAADAPASVINVATVSGGGDVTPANNSASDPTTIAAGNPADLTISKSHVGSFVRGTNGSYTILVTNAGGLPTTGKVTVTESLPAGLSLVSMSGTGWQCSAGSCSRTDVLTAGAIYPPITVTVQVTGGALASVTNTATVSGGGETNTANNTASDPTAIISSSTVSDLTIRSAHDGNFMQTQNGATYTITVTNLGTAATNGLVTVTDTVPNGLKATTISGPGWKCQQPSGPCMRNNPLQPSASYPDITLTVNVTDNAPATVVNQVAVSGGGEVNTANNSAIDSTTITPQANIIYSGRRNIVLKGVKGKNLTQIIHLAGGTGSWDALQLGIYANGSGGGSNDIWAGAEVALAVNSANRVKQFDSGDSFPKNPTFISGSAILWGFGTGSGDGDYFAAMKFGTFGGGPAYTGWIHLRIQNSSTNGGTITVVDWAYSDQVSQSIDMGEKRDSKRDDPRGGPRGCGGFRRQDCDDSRHDDDRWFLRQRVVGER